MGKIIISQNAIAKIAGLSAMESYGVVGLVPYKFKDKIRYLLDKKAIDKGVDVKVDGRNVEIDLYVVIQGGTKVSEIAKTIISQVSYRVKSLTGIENVEVNVIVKGVKREE